MKNVRVGQTTKFLNSREVERLTEFDNSLMCLKA